MRNDWQPIRFEVNGVDYEIAPEGVYACTIECSHPLQSQDVTGLIAIMEHLSLAICRMRDAGVQE